MKGDLLMASTGGGVLGKVFFLMMMIAFMQILTLQ